MRVVSSVVKVGFPVVRRKSVVVEKKQWMLSSRILSHGEWIVLARRKEQSIRHLNTSRCTLTPLELPPLHGKQTSYFYNSSTTEILLGVSGGLPQGVAYFESILFNQQQPLRRPASRSFLFDVTWPSSDTMSNLWGVEELFKTSLVKWWISSTPMSAAKCRCFAGEADIRYRGAYSAADKMRPVTWYIFHIRTHTRIDIEQRWCALVKQFHRVRKSLSDHLKCAPKKTQ